MRNKKAGPTRLVRKKRYPTFNVGEDAWGFLYNFQRSQKKSPNSICNYPVYLILKYKYLMKIFNEKVLHFSNIEESWKDVYERFFAKNNFFTAESYTAKSKTETTLRNLFSCTLYGQSWSYNNCSDAMWRIYSDINDKASPEGQMLVNETDFEECGIRIKTTLSKLFDILTKNASDEKQPLMGNVIYKEPRELNKWINRHQVINKSSFPKVFKESLFIKRDNFGHENELRILFLVPEGSKIEEVDKGIKIPLNPNNPFEFIEEIAVDPRIDTRIAKEKIEQIKKVIHDSQEGLEKKRTIFVKQSDLYHFKATDVIVVP